MITCYFGIPGCGKSTILTATARKELRKKKFHRSKYKHIYSNFAIKGVEKITFKDLESFKMYDSLIILDELTLDADNRNFKSFPIGVRDFFILHRHLGNDIVYATQNYDKVDIKIRALTDDLWYMKKSYLPFFNKFTSATRIFRNININQFTSDLVMGYRFASFLEAIFSHAKKVVFRPKWYKYFDSFEEGVLETRPVFISEEYKFQDRDSRLLYNLVGLKKNLRFRKKSLKAVKEELE